MSVDTNTAYGGVQLSAAGTVCSMLVQLVTNFRCYDLIRFERMRIREGPVDMYCKQSSMRALDSRNSATLFGALLKLVTP